MKSIKTNNYGSAIPLILFLITIVSCGALFTLFFTEIGFPALVSFVPDSDSKTFIMMGLRAIPLFIAVIGVIALIKEGLKMRGVTYP